MTRPVGRELRGGKAARGHMPVWRLCRRQGQDVLPIYADSSIILVRVPAAVLWSGQGS